MDRIRSVDNDSSISDSWFYSASLGEAELFFDDGYVGWLDNKSCCVGISFKQFAERYSGGKLFDGISADDVFESLGGTGFNINGDINGCRYIDRFMS